MLIKKKEIKNNRKNPLKKVLKKIYQINNNNKANLQKVRFNKK